MRIRFEHPRIITGAGGTTVTSLTVDETGRICDPADSGGPVQIEQLPGDVVVPGFIDTHAHLSSLGGGLDDIDVRDVTSPAELLDAVASRATELPEQAWVTGTGWVDSPQWGGLPNAAELDRAAGGRPVALFRRDRHALLASAAALGLAGIDLATTDPAGGAIERGAPGGRPTGLLIDTAMDLLTVAIPAASTETLAREAATKAAHLAELGVTCVHEAWVGVDLWRGLISLAESGKLPIRVRAMLGEGWEDLEAPPASGRPDWLRAIAVKGFADGALGSRGAQLIEPYADVATAGIAVMSDAELAQRADLAERLELQLAVHAIGDEAFRRVLSLYEARAGADRPSFYRQRRWRIEHAQLIAASDLARIDGLGLAVQPVHFWADGAWATERLGRDRLACSHRIGSLLEAGARVGFGSDFPIESGDPREGLRAACAAEHPGAPHWPRDIECVAAPVALGCYWSDAAWLARDELCLGRLEAGFLADFVCLDGDPFAIADPLRLSVVGTWVGGRPTA